MGGHFIRTFSTHLFPFFVFTLLTFANYAASFRPSCTSQEFPALMRESHYGLDFAPSGDALHLEAQSEPEILNPTADGSLQGRCCDPDLNSPWKLYSRQAVLSYLQANVPEKRLQHILRVEEMAIALAQHHSLDAEKAAQAGLMHDLAKFFPANQLLDIARTAGLDLDCVFEANPHLLHADVGAIVARDRFGIEDDTVLDAIRNHTLGRPGMGPLSCVVYLADGLEPGRGNTAELEMLRQECWDNLYRAVWLTCEYTMRSLFSTHHPIHPRAILTRNWAIRVATGKTQPS